CARDRNARSPPNSPARCTWKSFRLSDAGSREDRALSVQNVEMIGAQFVRVPAAKIDRQTQPRDYSAQLCDRAGPGPTSTCREREQSGNSSCATTTARVSRP